MMRQACKYLSLLREQIASAKPGQCVAIENQRRLPPMFLDQTVTTITCYYVCHLAELHRVMYYGPLAEEHTVTAHLYDIIGQPVPNNQALLTTK